MSIPGPKPLPTGPKPPIKMVGQKPAIDPPARALSLDLPLRSDSPMIVLHHEATGAAFAVKLSDVASIFEREGKVFMHAHGAELPIKEVLSVAVAAHNRLARGVAPDALAQPSDYEIAKRAADAVLTWMDEKGSRRQIVRGGVARVEPSLNDLLGVILEGINRP